VRRLGGALLVACLVARSAGAGPNETLTAEIWRSLKAGKASAYTRLIVPEKRVKARAEFADMRRALKELRFWSLSWKVAGTECGPGQPGQPEIYSSCALSVDHGNDRVTLDVWAVLRNGRWLATEVRLAPNGSDQDYMPSDQFGIH
jgi:hypothetical protein